MTLKALVKKLLVPLVVLGASIVCMSQSNDYREWLEIEVPGGPPPNLLGYLFSLLATLIFSRDRRDLRNLKIDGGKRYLEDLPFRDYGEPDIARWCIPHRQVSQIAYDIGLEDVSNSDFHKFFNSFTESPNCYIGISKVEDSLPALFIKGPSKEKEVIHRHTKDGSFHISLSRADASTVIKYKWGELHPLPEFFREHDETNILLYAPQNPDDYRVFSKIIDASILFYTNRFSS
mmetsp:Transcript_960/g.960  ORF Transcript_960/g.960 Transcript_960/m.960 type:complete len:233 (+) Transcript_960:222-920(+)